MSAMFEDAVITDAYWALKHKFTVEIGLRNEIDPRYDDIIWFKQGMFLINSFTYSRQSNSLSISISGKDKLSLLDGTIGGKVMAETKFDTLEEEGQYGIYTLTKLPVYTIIQQAVKNFGNEDIRNIIIKDLDINGYELWEYIGDDPMYFFINSETYKIFNMTTNGDMFVYKDNIEDKKFKIKELEQYYVFNPMLQNGNANATKVQIIGDTEKRSFYVLRLQHGDTAGYHQTELIYPEDLILKPGETITTLLDKIVQMLGQYEYFYDLDGHFVFQKQKMYATNFTSPIVGLDPILTIPEYVYKFEDESMFVSVNTNPDINKVKNDFCVWGTMKSATGKNISIHARYAIDEKPTTYWAQSWTSKKDEYYPEVFYHISGYNDLVPEIQDPNDPNKTIQVEAVECDWREVLYRMAQDYYRHQDPSVAGNAQFSTILESKNPWAKEGRTGYEQYYMDIQGFWRLLYNPEVCNEVNEGKDDTLGEEYFVKGEYKYWNKNIQNDPRSLIFWFDFLETEGELSNFSVHKIGSRPFQESKEVSSLYNTATPEIQFILSTDPKDQDTSKNSYADIYLPASLESLFKISSQTNSCLDLIANNLSTSTCQAEGLTITAIPIYYLTPNTRVYIEGKGDYYLSKISYSLTHNATMSLTLSKITKQFIKEVV